MVAARRTHPNKISNHYVNSSIAKLDSNFRYVSQTLPVTSDSQAMTQVAIANNASNDGYDYWVKADSGQWQKLDSAAQLGVLAPDTLVYMSQDYLDVWYRSEVQDTAYRYRRISAPLEARAVTQSNAPGKFFKVAAGGSLETRSYSYDANGNVFDIITPAGTHEYGYDALDRITDDAQPNQDPIGLGYDGNGNRTSRTQGESVTPYSYLQNSNILSDVDSAGYTHDAAGSRTSDQGGNRTFEYNNAGRLFKVYEGGSQIASYTYNALGQRTRKTTSSGTTVYHYDREGNLISETESDGRPIRDYVWQGAEPVAQVDIDGATETVTYLHTDHLATPRSATDDTGTVVWRWESDAFGKSQPAGSATVNLRFPGQYYDAETGLHYNYFRYYDPNAGRYLTSDPIGLEGGLNTYGYVGGNPLAWIDMNGLIAEEGSWEPGEIPDHGGANGVDTSIGFTGTMGVGNIGSTLSAGYEVRRCCGKDNKVYIEKFASTTMGFSVGASVRLSGGKSGNFTPNSGGPLPSCLNIPTIAANRAGDFTFQFGPVVVNREIGGWKVGATAGIGISERKGTEGFIFSRL